MRTEYSLMLILIAVGMASCSGQSTSFGHQTPLHIAAAEGDISVIKSYPKSSPEINAPDEAGQAPLHRAACDDQLAAIRMLVAKGADVAAKDKYGATPLHTAADCGCVRAAALLLNLGADPNAGDNEGLSPLHHAGRAGNTYMANLLVRQGAEVKTIFDAALLGDDSKVAAFLKRDPRCARTHDSKNWSPLLAAIWGGSVSTAKLVINGGADVNAASDGWTPLYTATHCCSRDIVQELVEHGADVNGTTEEFRETPLCHACSHDVLATSGYLLGHGASLKGVKNGPTPLCQAVQQDDLRLVDLLIAHGADANEHSYKGSRIECVPLECVRSARVARRLIEHGAKVTNILEAIAACKISAVRQFIKSDRSSLHANADGNTPMSVAAAVGSDEIVRLLLANGSSVNVKGRDEQDPLAAAAESGSALLVKLLLSHGAKIGAGIALHNAGTPESAAALVAGGAKVESRNDDDETPLYSAIRKGRADVAMYLVRKGANVNAATVYGWSPLHEAARENAYSIAALLVSKGAKVDAKDMADWTPLHVAASAGSKKMVAFLVSHGASVNAEVYYGKKTPAMLAAENGHDNVRALLGHR